MMHHKSGSTQVMCRQAPLMTGLHDSVKASLVVAVALSVPRCRCGGRSCSDWVALGQLHHAAGVASLRHDALCV